VTIGTEKYMGKKMTNKAKQPSRETQHPEPKKMVSPELTKNTESVRFRHCSCCGDLHHIIRGRTYKQCEHTVLQRWACLSGK